MAGVAGKILQSSEEPGSGYSAGVTTSSGKTGICSKDDEDS